jgi:hypothetical protein
VAVNSTAALLLLALVLPDKEMAAVLFHTTAVKDQEPLLLLVVAAPLLADSTAQCLAEEMVVLAHNAWPLAQRLGTLEAEEALLSLFRARTCLEESEALAAEAAIAKARAEAEAKARAEAEAAKVRAEEAAAATAKSHSNGRTALMAPRVASYLRAAPAREPLALAAVVVWCAHPEAGVSRARHGARRILWRRRQSQMSQVCPWRRRRRRLHATWHGRGPGWLVASG